MTLLTIAGETFRVEVEGDATKPAVLLSNSLGTDLSMWDGQIADLTKHFRVIRYDPRGHGDSEVGKAPASIARLGTDVLGILDALEIETTHVIGLSMGGAVAIWLLANAPHRIGRAVLANTAARLGTAETWNTRITSVLGDGMADNAAATIERWFSPDFAAREPARVEDIHAMLRGASPQGYADACAALRDMDLRGQIGTIGNDVLVVTGRDDPVVSDEDTRALVEGIAGAEHVALAARHMSNIEAQADFNAATIGFLTRPVRKAPKARTAPRKTSPMKRGGAARRSNAARSPLEKAPAKRTAATRAQPKKSPAKKAARGATAKAAEAHRRPAPKRAATRRPASKTATPTTTKRPAKKARKATATRRPTPTATARGAVAKKATKRPTKTTASKSAANKTAAKKTATKKTATKATKKLPTARRKPAGKPRRPTGRGKR